MLVAGSAFKGYTIAASDGRIGSVRDLLFDDTTWNVRWLVVDTGSWLTTRKVLVHPSAVGQVDYDRQELSVTLSRKQIEDSPNVLSDQPVSQQLQNSLYSYYGWDPMWGGSYFGRGGMASPLSAPPYFGATSRHESAALADLEDAGDPHLRSSAEVVGYHLRASDGEIGHVENLLIEDSTWSIRYLIVDTRNWWPGQHVLLSPFAVRAMSYADRAIDLGVTQAQVKASPPWDPVDMIDHYYEQRLHSHYGWHGYGW